MRHAEALAALAADDRLGLVLDRRSLEGDRLRLSQLDIRGSVSLDANNSVVQAHLVASSRGGVLPPTIVGGPHSTHIRLLDRFYVPVTRDPVVTAAMFDLISDLYEGLANIAINIETAQCLLRAVLDGRVDQPKLLDFGCGTGLAVEALMQMGGDACLVGTDLSERMLSHAAARGETVMPVGEWRQDDRLFDGAFACFVIHYGVSDDDLARIARRLKPGARFAANYFKATAADIAQLETVMVACGLQLKGRLDILSHTTAVNPALLFEKTLR